MPDKDRVLVSYLTLRRIVGVLGVTFPVLLGVGSCGPLRDSISAYYCDPKVDGVFVGVLVVVGAFLFAYKGHDWRDDTLGDVGCFAALGVAFFPVDGAGLIKYLHYGSAALMFLVLATFCLCLFVESDKEEPNKEKIRRNNVYSSCGWTIIGCMGLLLCRALLNLLGVPLTWLEDLSPAFWLESAMLVAFGVSWFVKGDTLLRDAR